MRIEALNDTQPFLAGGGEMGAIIRAKDWSETSLGDASEWPQSLKTAVSIILSSKFPMFLWWGPELIQFYNDAYRPSLGKNGKHPSAIGQKAEDCWPEIWPIIKPLIDQVMTGGESTWSEDQLIPIYRNGRLEDVYWTFSYSPVKDESGSVNGVLVVCSETTSKVNGLLRIKESEQRFKDTVKQAPVGIAIFKGPEFIVETANETYLQIVDKTEDDFIGKPIFNSLPEVKEVVEPLFKNVIETGTPFYGTEIEVMLNRFGKKETTFFNLVYQPFRETNGTINGIIVVATEVTEQVKNRQNIKDVAERLHLATEGSQMATWDLNLITEEIIYSPRLSEIFGFEHSRKITHTDLRNQIHEDDRYEIVIKAFDRAIQTGVLNYEARLVRPDNTTRWIRTRGKIIFDEARKPLRMLGTLMDITDQKHNEQIIKKSEKKFRTLSDSMPQQAWTSDPAGNLNYFNQAVYNYSGLTYQQIKKDGWLQIVHPEDREENIKRWAHSIATGEPFLVEHRFRRHDGEYRWQLSRAIPQKDDEGNIQMWVGTSTDIQDQKMFSLDLETKIYQRTKELKQSNDDLVKLNNELAQFAYVASHDLQEPLRKIQTFASRIQDLEEPNLTEKGKDYFARMQSASRRMQQLILDLLSYSRANAAEKHFEFSDLNRLLEEIKEQLKESIEKKQAIIKSTQLPSLKIIPYQFEQLLTNLISNALKFSKEGKKPEIKISYAITGGNHINSIEADSNSNYHHISVADNGIGFDPQFRERIFQVFQRLHNKEEYEGTGIGLAICKKIVENHNGIITAGGVKNEGAVFNIYIPLES